MQKVDRHTLNDILRRADMNIIDYVEDKMRKYVRDARDLRFLAEDTMKLPPVESHKSGK